MARYEQSYEGERRTVHLGVQLTPSERRELETAAEKAGARLSPYVRELCLSRLPVVGIVAGTRRNPDAKALMGELAAVGNNLNQLSRHANTSGAMPEARELRDVLDMVKAAMGHVLAL
jgi:hypothetical protein